MSGLCDDTWGIVKGGIARGSAGHQFTLALRVGWGCADGVEILQCMCDVETKVLTALSSCII